MDESIAASLAQTRAQRELEPHCPACGCTDIQVVRKNWSPGSGIFTNQVERVCARCLFRF
ncbi:MAG: hypothetical protein LIO46_04185 [Clostridiales bacterium]|nr:hypothetical protein [Clostridiales bacterium]